MIEIINLKGILGDNIFVTVDTENTSTITVKFDDPNSQGLKSADDLPDLVNSMGWSYSSKKDLELTESIYNVEISKKKLWSDAGNT